MSPPDESDEAEIYVEVRMVFLVLLFRPWHKLIEALKDCRLDGFRGCTVVLSNISKRLIIVGKEKNDGWIHPMVQKGRCWTQSTSEGGRYKGRGPNRSLRKFLRQDQIDFRSCYLWLCINIGKEQIK